MSTDLGREVALNDWLGFHRDRLLSTLFQLQEQGHPTPGFQVSMIGGITGLRDQEALQLAHALVEEGLLVKDGEVFRPTPSGLQWVRDSPAR